MGDRDVGEGGAGRDAVLTAPILDARSLVVRRGARLVLDGLDVSVAPGEVLSIVGPNGAGKSTLLLAWLGLLPFAGTLRLAGRDARALSPRERARLLAYVPQSEGRTMPFTVEELVGLGRYAFWHGWRGPDAADREAVREALALTGTTAFARRPVAGLSGGERQKVMIAAALAQDARALLLDEPTAFLDPRHQCETAMLLRRLNRERGLAVVLVTHDLNLGARCADRVLALREGRAVYCGPTGDFLRGEVLEALYDVPFEVTGEAGGARAFPRIAP